VRNIRKRGANLARLDLQHATRKLQRRGLVRARPVAGCRGLVSRASAPGRIDLGVGRAAGTDNRTATALALRRSKDLLGADRSPDQLAELLGLPGSDRDPAIPFGPSKAVPTGVPAPELRVLGASVICGETDAHAEQLASSGDLGGLRFRQGLRDLPPAHGADLQG